MTEPREDHELAAEDLAEFLLMLARDYHMPPDLQEALLNGGNRMMKPGVLKAIIALARRPSPVAESTPSPDTEGVRLADELTSAIRIGVEDDVTIPFDLSVRIHAFLRTAQNTGRDEVLEERTKLFDRMAYFIGCIAHADQEGWNDATIREARLIAAALSSPPVSTVDEEGGGA